MKKMCLVLCLVIGGLVLPAASQAVEVGVRGYYWFPGLDGDVRVDAGGAVGTTVDLEQDLGIDDDEFAAVEVFLGAGRHHLSLAYTEVDYSGTKTLSRSITFNGQPYTASSIVNSAITYDMIDLRYQYDFMDLENVLAGFSLGGVLHLKYLDGDVNLKATGIDEKEDFTVPVPMLGLNLHLGILADLLEARVAGTGIAYSGDTMYDVLGELSWTPFPFVDVHGGYRIFATDIDQDDVVLDYTMSGPYVAITVSF